MNEGWGVAMMSYRGFRGSTGSPSEAANLADALLAYETLISEGVDPKALILYGELLGTGIAARIATERPAAGLILEAPYTSIVEIAVRAYPFLPVRGLLWDRYETRTYIADVRIPLLILHGERDGVIPVAMGRELIKLANEPKRLVVLPNAGHNDVYVDGNPGPRCRQVVDRRAETAKAQLMAPAAPRGSNALQANSGVGAESAYLGPPKPPPNPPPLRGGPPEPPRPGPPPGRPPTPGLAPGLAAAALPGSKPSRWARLRASLRARRTASACSRTRFSDGFS